MASLMEILLLLLLFLARSFSHSVVDTLPGFPGKLPFKLETGYMGVGEFQQVQLFYYFIESEKSPESDPLFLWLAGGPGCSGLSSLLYEIGPLRINYANSTGDIPALELNQYAWTKLLQSCSSAGWRNIVIMAASILVLLLLLFMAPTFSNSEEIETLPGFPGKLPFKLQTGYIGVGEFDQVQLFYYFIESERSPENDPVLLWLTGGPGCSALSGLLYEIGPFTINYANSTGDIPSLELNPYAWTKVANIIFLDQPVGAGFSYAKTWEASRCSDTLSAQYAYSFLIKWFLDHPKFLSNPLYIAGDSYAGIIIPQIVQRIYDGLESGIEPRLNLKGYVEGNPTTDKYADYNNRVVYAHRVGLLSDNLYESTKVSCDGHYIDEPQNAACQYDLERVSKCTEKISMAQILEPVCSNENLLSLDVSSIGGNVTSLLLPQQWCRDDNYVYSSIWANNKIVQKALHVREETITEWVRCNKSLKYEVNAERTEAYIYNVKSTVDYHKSFTNKSCRVLIYSGDHDMVISHLSTEEWIESLNFAVQDEWRPWFFEDQVAGYTMKYLEKEYELTYATVKGAGHTAPEYKPQQCLAMLQRWLDNYSL